MKRRPETNDYSDYERKMQTVMPVLVEMFGEDILLITGNIKAKVEQQEPVVTKPKFQIVK